MWNDGWTHDGMMGWTAGGWHWLFSFHGILSIVFFAVIIFALMAIVRDLRRRDDKSPTEITSGMRDARGENTPDEYLETERHLKA